MTKATRAAPIARSMRADILSGRLKPGEQLKFQALVSRHDASIPVIREALTHLVESGLVQTEAHHGYQVRQHTQEELVGLVHARLIVEPAVLEDSILHGEPQWEANLVGAHHLLSRTSLLSPDDPTRLDDEWVVAHASFHAALLAGARGHRLQAFALRLRDEAELLRQRSVSVDPEYHRDIAAEHQTLVDLAVARRGKDAAEALKAHIARTVAGELEVEDRTWFELPEALIEERGW